MNNKSSAELLSDLNFMNRISIDILVCHNELDPNLLKNNPLMKKT